ncbi:MAG: hypothetical protein HQ567_18750 [Candidatus Nealsonbacteria bacterium]|nr:hypothetical protein [Candidatus Nealsonbacteria bacterium]
MCAIEDREPPIQFGIRSLFWLTLAVALTCAFGAWAGRTALLNVAFFYGLFAASMLACVLRWRFLHPESATPEGATNTLKGLTLGWVVVLAIAFLLRMLLLPELG